MWQAQYFTHFRIFVSEGDLQQTSVSILDQPTDVHTTYSGNHLNYIVPSRQYERTDEQNNGKVWLHHQWLKTNLFWDDGEVVWVAGKTSQVVYVQLVVMFACCWERLREWPSIIYHFSTLQYAIVSSCTVGHQICQDR